MQVSPGAMLATLTLTTGERMVFELYPEKAPITTASFVDLCDSGFYDGLQICRIAKGWVLQGGSPDNDIMTDSHFHLEGEFAENGHDTGLDHRRGALSMARDDTPNTAGTQFFIVHQDAHVLDGRYAAFGQMVEGYDVMDRLAELPTSGKETWNKPLDPPVIASFRVDRRGLPLPPVRRLP